MKPKPIIHLCSSLLIIGGILYTQNSMMLGLACVICVVLLIASGEASALQRFLIAILPIAMMLFLIDTFLKHLGPSHSDNTPMFIVLRLSALMLTFSYATLYFLREDSAERLVALGLRGNWLVITLSAISTLPLMRLISKQIIDARYAAGMIKSRSIASTIFQLPYIMRPLFTQALRLAVARSDNWHQRDLMGRFELNIVAKKTRLKLQLVDYVLVSVSVAWVITVAFTRKAG